MTYIRSIVLGVWCAVLTFGVARAEQEVDPEAIAAIRDCLAEFAEAGEPGFHCIEIVSKPCLAAQGGDTTFGMVMCLDRSIAAWDALLNAAYKAAREKIGKPLDDRLRDVQRAWIVFRDERCGLEEAFYEGGTLARVVYLACYEQETAIRAIDVIAVLREAEAR